MNKTIFALLRFGCILCFLLALVIHYNIPFAKFAFTIIGGFMAFYFSPIKLLQSIFFTSFSFEKKVFISFVCIYCSLISGNSIITLFATDINQATTIFYIILPLMFFMFSEYWLKKKNGAIDDVSGYKRIRFWFLLFFTHPVIIILNKLFN